MARKRVLVIPEDDYLKKRIVIENLEGRPFVVAELGQIITDVAPDRSTTFLKAELKIKCPH